jgi:hypothetical protein
MSNWGRVEKQAVTSPKIAAILSVQSTIATFERELVLASKVRAN